MRKAKRFICIIMAALTIISAPLTSYIEAQAGELVLDPVLDLPFVENLLTMFGIDIGLGDQYDYWKRQSEIKELFKAAASGGTAELEGYGTVNFSETESLGEWFEWSLNCQKFLLGNLSVINPEDAARYMEVGKALDKVSYKNSGTCASNALNDCISDVYEEYKTDPQRVLEEIRNAAKIICSPDTEITDISDAEARAEFNRNFWKTFCAVTAAGMLGAGSAAVPLTALKIYSDSEFNDYDALFGEACFDGNYTMNANGQYVYSISGDGSTYRFVFDKAVSSDKIVGVIDHESNMVSFYKLGYNGSLPFLDIANLRISQQIDLSSGRVYENGKSYNYCGSNNYSGNIPLYSSREAALDALVSGNFSGAENLNSYADFKSDTGTAGAVIGNPLSDYVGSLKSLADIVDIIPAVKEASDTYGGTSEMLPEIARILSEAGDLAISKPDTDDPSSSTNYSGILGKILAAINRLPASILSALTGKFMTAERLETLINGIPIALAGVISDAYTDSQISVLPGILSDVLSSVFPDAASAIKALTDLPAYIVSAVSGIQVKVPDIVIPDIVIPDIVIPDIVIPDIAVPDVFVEAPAVTLNPAFDITVANDYAGLEGTISKAVEGVLTDVFVPDEALTLEKIGEMQEYFEFKDDIIAAVDDLKTMIFGITPSPILKIPVGKTTSKKYDYGTGNYIIIDVSWYAPYKQFGDKVILAIVWALFLWRMFLKLPGIISGTEGSIMAADRSYQKYTIGKD